MRGTWVLAAAALTLTAGAFWYSTSKPSGDRPEPPTAGPAASEFVQATQQQQAFVPKGFDNGRAARVEEIHAHVVATLDDLDAANGVRRVKTPDGERIVKVTPAFGAGRMEVLIAHDGELYATGTQRPGTGTSDPFLLIASAHGKPLTAENLDWPKPAKSRFASANSKFSSPKEHKQEPSEMVKQSAKRGEAIRKERLDALRKLVSRANQGWDSNIDTSDAFGWVKPLKLTKEECLPCHQGMKIGDTVGIIAYMHGK